MKFLKLPQRAKNDVQIASYVEISVYQYFYSQKSPVKKLKKFHSFFQGMAGCSDRSKLHLSNVFDKSAGSES